MKIAVTGIHGNIGSVLIKRGAVPLDCDVRDEKQIRRALREASPDIVIHTASKSKPDWCERNTEEALQVNFKGSMNVATECEKLHIPVVALSTDHIFAGEFMWTKFGFTGAGPYSESYHKIFPINFYGLTKFAMEALMESYDNVKVVRTSNCFWSNDPRVRWYIERLYDSERVPVPTFQYRSFMHRESFCESIEKYCERFDKMPKILHISGSETVNWYDFILAFADVLDIPKALTRKFTKKRFETGNFSAKRPKKGGLKVDLSTKLGLPQYSYLDGLELLK